MKPKKIKLFWSLGLALLLLSAAGVLPVLWPRLFPSHYVSDLYLHYEHNPHIRTTELHSFHINDTLSVDALLLQADSDSAWCELMADFGMSKILIARFKTHKELYVGEDVNSIIMYYIDKSDIKKRMPNTDPNSRLVIGSHAERSICIFMTERKNTKEAIGLTKVKQLR